MKGSVGSFVGLGIVLILNSVLAHAEIGVTDTEIKVGADSVQTGLRPAYGITQRVIKAYFEKINSEGGINGRKINYIIADNQDNPQQTLQVTKKLVEEEKVFAIVGAGVNHQSAVKYLQQKKVPDLWIVDSLKVYSEPLNKWSFAYAGRNLDEGKFYGEYILKHFPGKKIGILSMSNDYGKESLEGFQKAVGSKAKLVTEESDIRTETVAKSQILKLKEAGVDVVYMNLPIPMAPATMKFAAEQGFKPQWFLAYYDAFQAMIALTGKDLPDGTLTWFAAYPETMDSDVVKQHKEFMAKYMPNEKISIGTMGGQAIGEIIAETFKRAGKNLTRESLVKAAESFNDYKCTFCMAANSTGPKKHLFTTNFKMLQAKGGKWVPAE